MPEQYIHYGVSGTWGGDEFEPPTVDGHSDPETEHEIALLGYSGYVSGSWACWGTADQITDGDGGRTLHVIARLPAAGWNERWLLTQRHELVGQVGVDSRVVDFAVVTGEDHSDLQAVVTFDPNGKVEVYPIR